MTEFMCKSCGFDLPPEHTGPCPKCGKKEKVVKVKKTANKK
jgi:predicted ATP-dependent serine protease